MKDVITKRQIQYLTADKISKMEDVGELKRIESKIRGMLSDIAQRTCHSTKLIAQDPNILQVMTLFGTQKILYKECECCERTLPMKMFFLTFKGNRKVAREICTECHKAFNGNAKRFFVSIKKKLDELTKNPLGRFMDNN
jgi:hypothetical protein